MTERNLKRCAIVGLLVTGVLTLATFSLGALDMFERTYGITAEFASASGIEPGAPVRLAGIEVGTVTSVERDPGAGTVLLDLDLKEGTELSEGTTAAIKLRSLLGAKYVHLDDSGEGGLLGSGSVIPVERTEVPVDLDELLGSLGDLTQPIDAAALNQAIGSMAGALEGHGTQLGTVLDGMRVLVGSVAARTSDLDRLVVASERLAAAFDSRRSELGSTVDDLAAVLTVLEQRRADLTNLVGGVADLAEQLTPLLHDNRDELDTLLADVTTAVSALDEQRDRLDLALEQLPVLAQRFTAITGQGPWVNVYFVGIVPGPYVMNPIDLGAGDGLEPGEDGGLPTVWVDPPTLLPTTTVGGTTVVTDEGESPEPPTGYPGG